MKQLLYILLVFFFCFSTTALSQNPERINYTKKIEQTNAIIPDFQVNEIQGSVAPFYWNDPNPSISADDNGCFVITWQDFRNGDHDIYAQRYANDGSPLGSNFQVNDDAGVETQYSPSISTDGSGNFVITWKDYRNGDADIYTQRYASDGSPLGINYIVNDHFGSAQTESTPMVSTDQSRNFVITWGDWRNGNHDIYAQRFASDGSPLGTNFKVNDDLGIAWQRKSFVSMDRAGNFVIAWSEDRRNDDPDIYAQRYSSDGTALGNNFKVNDEVGYTWYSYSGPTSPSIDSDSSGNFVITWAENRIFEADPYADIYAQRYSIDGIALGSNIKINDDIDSSAQWFSSISTDDNGNFVITWNDARNGDPDIYAQRYTNSGNKIGNNFLVTNSCDSLQYSPSVKLWNGRIYTVWTDNRDVGFGYDIWANVLDWNNPVGVEDEETLEIPSAFSLSQNYPNPFNPTTKIKYSVPQSSNVEIKVFDILGNEIETLVNEEKSTGIYELTWYASNLPSGVYFYQLKAESFIETKKMILLK